MVNEITFVGFRGSDRPNLPLLDPPLSASNLVKISEQVQMCIAA